MFARRHIQICSLFTFFFARLAFSDGAFLEKLRPTELSQFGAASVELYQPENLSEPTNFYCSAGILNSSFVITAAHCVEGIPNFSEQNRIQLVVSTGNPSGRSHFVRRAYFPKCFQEQKTFRIGDSFSSIPNNPECDYALLELVDPIQNAHDAITTPFVTNEEEPHCVYAKTSWFGNEGEWKSCGFKKNTPRLTLSRSVEFLLLSPVLKAFSIRAVPGFSGSGLKDTSGNFVGILTHSYLDGLRADEPESVFRIFDGSLLKQLGDWQAGVPRVDTEVVSYGWEMDSNDKSSPIRGFLFYSTQVTETRPVLVRRTAATPDIVRFRINMGPATRDVPGLVKTFRYYQFDFSKAPRLAPSQEELFQLTFESEYEAKLWRRSDEQLRMTAKLVPISTVRDYEFKAKKSRLLIR